MRNYCNEIGATPIFNTEDEADTLRLQYSFPPLEELPLEVAGVAQQLTFLRHWLKVLLPFNQLARSWTCLESTAGCAQQQVHTDYEFQAVSDAVASGGPTVLPYVCTLIL